MEDHEQLFLTDLCNGVYDHLGKERGEEQGKEQDKEETRQEKIDEHMLEQWAREDGVLMGDVHWKAFYKTPRSRAYRPIPEVMSASPYNWDITVMSSTFDKHILQIHLVETTHYTIIPKGMTTSPLEFVDGTCSGRISFHTTSRIQSQVYPSAFLRMRYDIVTPDGRRIASAMSPKFQIIYRRPAEFKMYKKCGSAKREREEDLADGVEKVVAETDGPAKKKTKPSDKQCYRTQRVYLRSFVDSLNKTSRDILWKYLVECTKTEKEDGGYEEEDEEEDEEEEE